jgi:hypothetical protein
MPNGSRVVITVYDPDTDPLPENAFTIHGIHFNSID